MGFGKLGVVFGRLGIASKKTGFVPSTPVLQMDVTWDTTQKNPIFDIDVDDTVVAGDTITFQIQATGGNWSSPVVNVTHTITAPEDAANAATLTLGPLSNATYDARAKVHHINDSAWSNTVTFTINAATNVATFYILGF